MTATETPPNPDRVAVYFSAHQDDWQLFMNPPAFRDVRDTSARCVFVHMAPGDAGFGTGNGGRRHPLYLARENGAEFAIRFMADANGQMPSAPVTDAPSYAGHAIRRVAYCNTVAYFLRLPDGNPEGTGYAVTGYQSLKRLAAGEIATMTAIDGSATYRGWDDLIATLRGLIEAERGPTSRLELHVPEGDATLNPGDHADHMSTAQAARDATHGMTARHIHHVGYASAQRPENLAAADRDMKCAVYAVTMAGVLALDHPVSWQHYDTLYAGRDYSRVETRTGQMPR